VKAGGAYPSAMAFPWDNLITAAAAVIGAVSGAGITGYIASKRSDKEADRAEAMARDDRRRDAYAAVLVTGRAALRNFRQLTLAYAANTPDTQEVRGVIGTASDIAGSLIEAIAVTELVGSPRVRQLARSIYQKARACSMAYQSHSVLEAQVKTVFSFLPPQKFDAKEAEQRCAELATAIEAFADVARDEITGNVDRH
jgi:hypothetical protein